MRILDSRALRGANLYAAEPVIYLLLDGQALAAGVPGDVRSAVERQIAALSGVEAGIEPSDGAAESAAAWLVLRAACALQAAAGMPIGEGRVWPAPQRGVCALAYGYRDEEAGLNAGEAAVALVAAAAAGQPFDVAAAVQALRGGAARRSLGISTGSIVAEAQRRGIPALVWEAADLIQLGHGARQQRIDATMCGRTSGIGVEIAGDKERTKRLLAEHSVPVPPGETVRTLAGALEAAAEIGYPVVVKPRSGNHGRGITTNVRSNDELRAAFEQAKQVHERVLVERFLVGSDFRLLVIDHRFVAAARRDPPAVVGDGLRTVHELIEALNADPRRGEGHDRALTRVALDADLVQMLHRRGLLLRSVPAEGQVVPLKSVANLSSGGTATDVTDEVHPAVRRMAERVSRLVGLDIIGLDIVSPTLGMPLPESGGGIVEVNAAPGFRAHLQPTHGQPRDVAAAVVDMLFPGGSDGRVPIAGVTGTNGKTTTCRLLSHILRGNGARVGLATTGAVEIDGEPVAEGDYSGPAGARMVLGDATVDAAVLEVARGEILRRGLGFDACDVGVLLNVASDHLGEGGIDSLADLARLKGAVLRATRPGGTIVLNADDPLVLAQREGLRARAVLFSLDPASPALRQHLSAGGAGATVQDGELVLCQGAVALRVAAVEDIPLAFGGRCSFNVQNALAAAAAAHALGVPAAAIGRGLATFQPTPEQLPGRMNLLDVQDFQVLLDYGHNVAALRALAELLPDLSSGRRITVASASGNRRDEDIIAFGEIIGNTYDFIFLCDPDPRGRAPGETGDLLQEGLLRAGFPRGHCCAITDEGAAIEAALTMARPGDIVVLQLEDVPAGIRRVRAWGAQAEGPEPREAPAYTALSSA